MDKNFFLFTFMSLLIIAQIILGLMEHFRKFRKTKKDVKIYHILLPKPIPVTFFSFNQSPPPLTPAELCIFYTFSLPKCDPAMSYIVEASSFLSSIH